MFVILAYLGTRRMERESANQMHVRLMKKSILLLGLVRACLDSRGIPLGIVEERLGLELLLHVKRMQRIVRLRINVCAIQGILWMLRMFARLHLCRFVDLMKRIII